MRREMGESDLGFFPTIAIRGIGGRAGLGRERDIGREKESWDVARRERKSAGVGQIVNKR